MKDIMPKTIYSRNDFLGQHQREKPLHSTYKSFSGGCMKQTIQQNLYIDDWSYLSRIERRDSKIMGTPFKIKIYLT